MTEIKRSARLCLAVSAVSVGLLYVGCAGKQTAITTGATSIEQRIKGIQANPEIPQEAKDHAIQQLREKQQNAAARPGG